MAEEFHFTRKTYWHKAIFYSILFFFPVVCHSNGNQNHMACNNKKKCMHAYSANREENSRYHSKGQAVLHTRSPFKNETCTNLLDLNSRTWIQYIGRWNRTLSQHINSRPDFKDGRSTDENSTERFRATFLTRKFWNCKLRFKTLNLWMLLC